MVARAQPFLMFMGEAEAAMDAYTGLFADGAILSIDRYGEDEEGPPGSVRLASFQVAGQIFRCIDSPVPHAFGFTPAFSIFVDVTSEAELERLARALGEGGQILMPLDDYGFSRRFTWLSDRWGVSWQLNLP